MTDANAVTKPKTWIRKLLKFSLLVSVALVALYCVAKLVWRFSGSNQWELVRDENGAKVYALKEPGSDLEQFKGSVRVRSTLSRAVAWLQDPDTCKDAGCVDPQMLEQVDDQLQYSSMHIRMPGFFRPREFVLRTRFHQIPTTKEIWAEYAAAPEKAPPNDCCFRVTNMNNTWRLTPLGNGELEIEYSMNMDWGGFIPDILSNSVRPKYLFVQLRQLQKYLDRAKYRDARFDFIQEDTMPAAGDAGMTTTRAAEEKASGGSAGANPGNP